MKNRVIVSLIVVLFIWNRAMSQEILNPTEKPNILFKLSDDHTSQAWGIYGGPLVDHVQNKNIKHTYPPKPKDSKLQSTCD
jgi:hypothetical protein